MSVKILIDSASDLNEEEAKKLNIELMPIKVQFGDEEYLDGFNLLPTEFYEKLSQSKELPKTSLINEYQFEEKFKELTSDGSEVVVITLSSKLSGTHHCAVEAAKKFNDKVFVVDSLSATMGEKALVLYALNLIDKGLTAKEIAAKLEEKKTKINIVAVVDTLKYLKMGGRVSAATAFVGEMLSIKPLIAVIDGEVKVLGKAHGLKKAFTSINDKVKSKGGIDFDMPHGLIWSGNDDSNIKAYYEKSRELWEDTLSQMPTYRIGSTIGTHVGPGAIGVVFFEK